MNDILFLYIFFGHRYQSHSVREYIVTTATETKPKYPTYESPITRAAEVVANTPTKSALHATLHGEYQPASSAADSSGKSRLGSQFSTIHNSLPFILIMDQPGAGYRVS